MHTHWRPELSQVNLLLLSRLVREVLPSLHLHCNRWHCLMHREFGKGRTLALQLQQFPTVVS